MAEHEAADAERPLIETCPRDGVAWLTINRPAVRNALNLDLRRRLAEAFTRLDADDRVRVIVIGGDARAFCAGADLTEYVDATPDEVVARDMGRLWDAIGGCRKPVIAAVRGYALGGGCELAMHADLIIAADTARFGQPEVKIGLMPGGGATQRLPRAIGKYQAMRWLLTGDLLPAEQVLALGLASEIVEDASLEAHVLELAERLAGLPAKAIAATKKAVLAGMDTGVSAGLAFERQSFALLFDTADKTEGIRAILEKRAPRFTHR